VAVTNELPPKPTGELLGYSVGAAAAGVRDGRPSRLDVALIVSDRPCFAGGVFTTNQVIAAPCVVTSVMPLRWLRPRLKRSAAIRTKSR